MKKKYVAPESRLFAINLNENIAASSGISEVSGSAVIRFSQTKDGCRGVYTDTPNATVDESITSFAGYYEQLLTYGAEVYFKCFRYQFNG